MAFVLVYRIKKALERHLHLGRELKDHAPPTHSAPCGARIMFESMRSASELRNSGATFLQCVYKEVFCDSN